MASEMRKTCRADLISLIEKLLDRFCRCLQSKGRFEWQFAVSQSLVPRPRPIPHDRK